ncbi:MAG: hypothetical protein IJT20_01140 [Synergistaceae bacterium]|nr:hypothetical protein [Synergistaceae bacterium]
MAKNYRQAFDVDICTAKRTEFQSTLPKRERRRAISTHAPDKGATS